MQTVQCYQMLCFLYQAPSPKFDHVKGRSLRSGRTIPDPLASVVGESDSTKDGVLTSTSEMEEEEVEIEEEEDNWEMLR